MKNILKDSKALQNSIVAHRRYIHKNAEVNMDLPLTTKYVMNKLKEMGYEPKEICKAGIVAIAGGKKPGKTFLLRADMDALPIKEETDLPFKSENGNMHACGHDMHTAMLLGAAKLLKNHEDEIEGSVKLMFQPAEETTKGAKSMIEAGVLENPKVDAAMMLHVFTGIPAPAGLTLIPNAGVGTSAADIFTIKVHGKGGHGAMPNVTVDPLNILSHIHIALQAINARELPSGDNAVLTVGIINGGDAANVIPDTASLSGTIRTYSKENREFIKKRIEEISKGIAATFRGSAEIEYPMECPSTINDGKLVEQYAEYNKMLLEPDFIVSTSDFAGGLLAKMAGSEDFAYLSELVPSVMGLLSASSKDGTFKYPQHHPKAFFSEEPLYIGAAMYANTAIEWLKSNK